MPLDAPTPDGLPPDPGGADLRHVDTWLFDLDNTLYPVETGIAQRMAGRMTDYVEALTGLPRPEALVLQKRYLLEYGLTLRGLMEHHGVDPDHYHAIFDDLPLDCLVVDPALAPALRRLPGRRLIFTNSGAHHTERVLEALGLGTTFDAVFHIASAAFIPKPSLPAFERIIAAHDIDPATTAFFEDTERNLEPAADLGMTTVLVGGHAEHSTAPCVHHRTALLTPFLEQAQVREI
jgi:putative hydrolase of the HAD superfamily